MSVLILNLTDNVKSFENQFCDNLKNNIKEQVNILAMRGLELFDSTNLIEGYKIVVVVAHGGNSEQTITYLDTGLDLGVAIPQHIYAMLNSPTILTQILGRNSNKYILIFCSCEALSAELLVSVIDDVNCIGTISSELKIHKNEYVGIAEIINNLHCLMENDVIDRSEVDSILAKSNMSYLFFDENNMKVNEDDV
jgi:hypothetical protein